MEGRMKRIYFKSRRSTTTWTQLFVHFKNAPYPIISLSLSAFRFRKLFAIIHKKKSNQRRKLSCYIFRLEILDPWAIRWGHPLRIHNLPYILFLFTEILDWRGCQSIRADSVGESKAYNGWLPLNETELNENHLLLKLDSPFLPRLLRRLKHRKPCSSAEDVSRSLPPSIVVLHTSYWLRLWFEIYREITLLKTTVGDNNWKWTIIISLVYEFASFVWAVRHRSRCQDST